MPNRQDGLPNLHYGDMFGRDKYVRMRYGKYTKLLFPFLKKGTKLLDVGGYRGELKLLLPGRVDYYVMDFDKKALEEARKKSAETAFVDFDNEPIKWNREKFDIVVATEVLEHLKDPKRHLKEISNILNKDGALLVSLPNENMLYHRLMSLFGFGVDLLAFNLYKHLHLPTIRQSRDFLSTEFDIIREDYYINVSAQASKFEFLGKIFGLLPDSFWSALANIWPGGFARGTIFLCKKKS